MFTPQYGSEVFLVGDLEHAHYALVFHPHLVHAPGLLVAALDDLAAYARADPARGAEAAEGVLDLIGGEAQIPDNPGWSVVWVHLAVRLDTLHDCWLAIVHPLTFMLDTVPAAAYLPHPAIQSKSNDVEGLVITAGLADEGVLCSGPVVPIKEASTILHFVARRTRSRSRWS